MTAALELTTHGIDLADAMHLCSRPPDATFVSFDRLLVRRVQRAGVQKVDPVSSGG